MENTQAQIYEKLFDEFLEDSSYDNASNAIFDLVRSAYQAGFLAAYQIGCENAQQCPKFFKKAE